MTNSTTSQRKSNSAKYGHIKRKLFKGEKITGEMLERALDMVADAPSGPDKEFFEKIKSKLKKGETLGEYELHIMFDVLALHRKLNG